MEVGFSEDGGAGGGGGVGGGGVEAPGGGRVTRGEMQLLVDAEHLRLREEGVGVTSLVCESHNCRRKLESCSQARVAERARSRRGRRNAGT